MKKIWILLMIPLIMGCPGYYEDFNYYSEYKPVLMTRNMLITSIKWIEKQPLKNPGKIYIKENMLYINEKYKGVHVIDNTNPSEPLNIGFIVIPGIVDIAMKGNVLFADNATDLVTIDLSAGLSNLKVTKRIENVFPEILPPDGRSVPSEYSKNNRPKNTVIVEWIKVKKGQ